MILTCPKCGGTQLHAVSEVHTHTTDGGFNVCEGLCCGSIGSIIFGPIGWIFALCGMGDKKTTTSSNTIWMCESCGKKFK